MVMYITLDKGTMFGGKSSVLHKYYRYYMKRKRNEEHLRILITKHSLDTRYNGESHIVTHDGKRIPCVPVVNLMDIDPHDWDVVVIDEGQFMPDLYKWVETYFRACDTRVHIAGLNGDKNQKNFGDINLISPFCSEEYVHYSMCAVCGDKAPFNKYRGDSSERDIIGGDDDYYTVCHKHLDTPVNEVETYIDYSNN